MWKPLLVPLSLSMLLASLGTSVANVGLPALGVAFGASFHEVQGVVLAYLLASTALIVSAGRLGDRFGRRRLLLAGLVLFTAASLACGAAPSLPLLIAARAAQGLGAAVLLSLPLALVAEAVPKDQTGRAMGLLATMSALGTALGPSLGGALLGAAGWRAIFLINVPLGLVTFGLARRALPVDRVAAGAVRSRFDPVGTLRLALGLRAALAMSALVAAVMMATMVVGPFYLSRDLGLPPATVGGLLSIGPIVVALTGVPAGRIADQLGAGRATLLGLLGMAAGCASLAMMPAAAGIPGYIGPIAILTASYALFQTANNAAVMADVVATERGGVSGLLTLARNLGLIAGASLLGALFARAGLQLTFAVAALLIGGAIAIAVAAGRSIVQRSGWNFTS